LVDVDECGAVIWSLVDHEANSYSLEGTQHQAQLRARLPLLHLTHPQPTDADAFRQGSLVEAEVSPALAQEGPDVSRGSESHGLQDAAGLAANAYKWTLPANAYSDKM
jgi:hypothetical protein